MRDEITLRDLINIIFKRKMLICIVTAVALFISGIYSFFIMEPEYSASTTLLANPIENKQIDLASGITEMIDSLAIYPNMTIDTYKEQVINSTILTDVINEFNLTDSKGKKVQWRILADKVSADVIKNTNLLKITVKNKDPEMAVKIANSVSDKFIKYISDNTRKFGEQAKSIIEESLNEEKMKLEEESKKLQEYLANSQNIEQIRLEIQSLNGKINTYNMQLVDVEKQINTDSEALSVLLNGQKKLGNVNLDNENNVKLNIGLDDSNSSQEMEIEINSSNDLKNSLIIIKTTEIETRLIQNLAEKTSLEEKIKELEVRLKDMRTLLAEEEYKYNTVQRNYNLVEQTYNAYLDRHKKAVLAATSDVGESSIIVSEQATIPIEPSNHGKFFYLAVGTFLGLMIGITIALILGYLQEVILSYEKT